MISSSRPLGSRPVSARMAGDLVDEVGLHELPRRQVDRHEQVRAVRPRVAPGGGLAAGGLEDPASERHDQPGLLGQRDERHRRHQAADRVLPANERLEADDPLGRQVDRAAGSGAEARRVRCPGAGRSRGRSARSSGRTSTARTGRGAWPGPTWRGPSRSRPRGASPRAWLDPAGRARSRSRR